MVNGGLAPARILPVYDFALWPLRISLTRIPDYPVEKVAKPRKTFRIEQVSNSPKPIIPTY